MKQFKLSRVQSVMEEQPPKPILVKTMTVNKKTGVVHNFFENMKYMEMGGTIRPGSLRKGNDGWWTSQYCW